METIIKSIKASDLINDEDLLKQMYKFVLKNYWDIGVEHFPISNYIKGIISNNMSKTIFYIEKSEISKFENTMNNALETKIISYLECEEIGSGKYYISTVATNKKHRSKGYASFLLSGVILFFKKCGFFEIVINVNKQKPYLFNFYKSLGFELKDNNDNCDEATYCYYNKK